MAGRLLLFALVSLVAVSIFIPGTTTSLLADDWHIVARNWDLSSQDAFQRFQAPHAGWYRPVFDLMINLCARIFGLNAIGFHLVAIILYALVTVLVGIIAEEITGDRGIGIISSLLFGIHSVHAEPVLWIASSNELLAALFALLSLKSYIAFRQSKKPILNYCLAGVFYLLAIASKETGVFLPMTFVAYDVWIYPSLINGRASLQKLIANIPFLVAQVLFMIFRLSTDHPYASAVPATRIAINAFYYLAVELFILPDNYGYLTSIPLWQQSPFLPILAIVMSAVSIGSLIWLYLRYAKSETFLRCSNVLKFACFWSLVALLPAIFTATGRTAFISSIGVVWLIATLLVLVWNNIRTKPALPRRILVLATSMFICINLAVSSYRVYWWRQANHTMENVLLQLNNELSRIPPKQDVCLVGLPDHLKHAYTFRNSFPHINSLLFPDHDIKVILDTELNGFVDSNDSCKDSITFWYNGSSLGQVD
jgi:hypothetical protein